MENITLILCSPLNRTTETALLSFRPLIEQGQTIILWAWLKEWGSSACNQGSSGEAIEKKLKGKPFDFKLVYNQWELIKDLARSRNDGADAERANEVRRSLKMLATTLIEGGKWCHLTFAPWKEDRNVEVIVVSHGNFLSSLIRSPGKSLPFSAFLDRPS
jgi:broad specificity phosphatase PhoE